VAGVGYVIEAASSVGEDGGSKANGPVTCLKGCRGAMEILGISSSSRDSTKLAEVLLPARGAMEILGISSSSRDSTKLAEELLPARGARSDQSPCSSLLARKPFGRDKFSFLGSDGSNKG
jgi:hypothetical protein